MCYLQIIIIIINFVPYTLSNHFLNKHLRMRLIGKKIHSRWHHVDHSSPTFTPFFKKAFYPKRHPVQDAKFWNYIPCLSLKTLKTKPCSAAHTRQGQINSLVCLRFFTTRQKKSYALTNHEVISIACIASVSVRVRQKIWDESKKEE